MINCPYTRRHYYRIGYCDVMNDKHPLTGVLIAAGEEWLLRAYMRGRRDGGLKLEARRKKRK